MQKITLNDFKINGEIEMVIKVSFIWSNAEKIGLSSQLRGPATNIVQTNLTGTSNIYSPYLYYNKGSSEKFYPSQNRFPGNM